MSRARKRYGLLVLSCLLLPLSCSRGKDKWEKLRPPTYPAGGEVLFEGKPLAGAVVTFMNEELGRSGTGITDPRGQFTMTTFVRNDGLVAGHHKVLVNCSGMDFPGTKYVGMTNQELNQAFKSMSAKEYDALPDPVARWTIPERYSSFEKSGLQADVVASGENRFRFDLKK